MSARLCRFPTCTKTVGRRGRDACAKHWPWSRLTHHYPFEQCDRERFGDPCVWCERYGVRSTLAALAPKKEDPPCSGHSEP